MCKQAKGNHTKYITKGATGGRYHSVIVAVRLLVSLSSVAYLMGCDLWYEPQLQPDPLRDKSSAGSTTIAGSGRIFGVNTGLQSCNPSICPKGPFSGSMLFLGYNELSVDVPDSLAPYDDLPVSTHDRLTVVDSSNTVRWYIMRSDLEDAGYFQCPEWSSHVDYCACLVGRIGKPHNGYALRFSDHRFLKICSGILEEFSYPHFWLPDTVLTPGTAENASLYQNGFVTRENLTAFFGTSRFKYVYALPSESGRLYFIDYSEDRDPTPVPLDKPEDRENWTCSSPLISPDGNWVAWHCFANASAGSRYASYIQALRAGATPILVAENASDPHWWVDPFTGTYYIIYTVTYDNYYTEFDFTDESVVNDDAAGCTIKQQLSGSWKEVPAHIGKLDVDRSIAPDTLLRLPFKGGLSADGYFMGTAYKYGYIAKLD